MNWDLVWTEGNLVRLLVGDLGRGEPGGLLLTLGLSVLGIVFATVFGACVGLMRTARSRFLSLPAAVYILTLRNVPLLILIFWAYFVPPYLGIETSKFASVAAALIFFTSAYIAEIVRGGIRSVTPGNIEAARALGLSNAEIQLWVVLPQAFHKMIPALTGRYITVVKNTSLAFLIGLTDLTEIGKEINARLMTAPIEVYFTLLLIYFIVNRGLSAMTRRLEDPRRFNRLFMRI
jgi:polar amino acid transport system permease protein